MQRKTIVLIGPMGVGKTTIGKKLARRLETIFVDTDQLITSTYKQSPAEIIQTDGEQVFRLREEAILAEALKHQAVISTGGGAVLSGNSQRALQEHTVIYLATDGRHMRSRLLGGNRPLLKNGFEDWKRIYEERKPLYENLADIEIDTSNKPLSALVNEICERLEQL